MNRIKNSLVHLLKVHFFIFIPSCVAARSDSNLKIINGEEVPFHHFASVPRIESDGVACTATFIGARILLTAAHCINGPEVRVHSFIHGMNPPSKKTYLSRNIIVHPKYDNPSSVDDWKSVGKYDLAAVITEDNVAPGVSTIYWKAAENGDDFIIVGYGYTSWPGYDGSQGRKRMGKNVIKSVADGIIEAEGSATSTDFGGTGSTAAKGDSGGPLLIDGYIAGVTSWGGVSKDEFGDDLNHMFYVDLRSRDSQDFLKEVEAESRKIDPTSKIAGSQWFD